MRPILVNALGVNTVCLTGVKSWPAPLQAVEITPVYKFRTEKFPGQMNVIMDMGDRSLLSPSTIPNTKKQDNRQKINRFIWLAALDNNTTHFELLWNVVLNDNQNLWCEDVIDIAVVASAVRVDVSCSGQAGPVRWSLTEASGAWQPPGKHVEASWREAQKSSMVFGSAGYNIALMIIRLLLQITHTTVRVIPLYRTLNRPGMNRPCFLQ